MKINGKSIQEVTADDIYTLKGQSIEGQYIDFKKNFTGGSVEHGKDELCEDIAAFGNAFGGLLIFGVGEKGGIVHSIEGIECDNPEELQNRVSQFLERGIEPFLYTDIRFVPIPDSTPQRGFLLIEVRRSINRPHRAIAKKTFPYRSASRKTHLSIYEIRREVALSTMEHDRIEAFRQKRFSNLTTALSDTAYIDPLNDNNIATHILLIPTFQSDLDVYDLGDSSIFSRFVYQSTNLNWSNLQSYYNLSGLKSNATRGYIQIFRNGSIELAALIGSRISHSTPHPCYYLLDIEMVVVAGVFNLLRISDYLKASPPFVIYIGFDNVGYPIKKDLDVISALSYLQDSPPRTFSLPNIHFNTFPQTLELTALALKPALDVLAGAAGLGRSPFFFGDEWLLKKDIR